MRASSPKLASEVALRLNAVVPPPLRLVAIDSEPHTSVGEKIDSIMGGLEHVGTGEGSELTREVEGVLVSILDRVQDDVSEYLQIPWPSADGRFMPSVGVRSDAEHVFLWYGDERAPVLRLSPIRIADIMM
jgi:hypothetical protein